MDSTSRTRRALSGRVGRQGRERIYVLRKKIQLPKSNTPKKMSHLIVVLSSIVSSKEVCGLTVEGNKEVDLSR